MQINQATVDLIKEFEGLRLTAYKCPAGVWTIGYGTTSNAGIGVTVKPGMTITKEQAEAYLWTSLHKFADEIRPLFTYTPNDNQFGAMLSLAFNIGATAFRKSTCLRRFNAGDVEGAGEALTWFKKAGGKVMRGLVRRRAAELALFNKGETATPTPKADGERTSPIQLKTNLSVIGSGLAVLSLLSDGLKAAIATVTDTFGVEPEQAQIIVILFLLAFIAWERRKKWLAGDR